MLNLAQRLILGCVLLAGLMVGLVLATHRALQAAGQWHLAWAIVVAAFLVAIGTVFFVLRPIQTLARDAHKIAGGNLDYRTEWKSHDDFGAIAAELNRLAVRLRDLHESEAGRRQMEFQLSDAVLQSIFEPIIVTDGKGHILKVNQAASELLGEAAGDRLALANTPGGDKILSAIRDAVALQKAVATEDEASMLPMRIGKKERSYRLRTMPMRDSEGRLLGTVTTLEDVTSLQDTDRFKTQFLQVASRKLRDPLLQLRRGLYALAQGFGGQLEPLQTELVAAAGKESEKLDELMADLIEVAELDSGKRELKLEPLRPFVALTNARDRYCDEAGRKRIRVDVRAYADLSRVQADRRALRSILDNLLANALRYTPEEGEILLAAEEVQNHV
jgi:two-component system, NtrC family, sensor histidine kinase KinB